MKYGEFARWKWRGLTEGIKYFGRAAGRDRRWPRTRRIENGEHPVDARYLARKGKSERYILEARNKYLWRYALRAIVSTSVRPVRAFTTDAARREGDPRFGFGRKSGGSRRGYPTRNYGQLSLAVVHPGRTDASLEGSRAEAKKKKKKKKWRRKTRSAHERSSK